MITRVSTCQPITLRASVTGGISAAAELVEQLRRRLSLRQIADRCGMPRRQAARLLREARQARQEAAHV